MCWTIVGYSLAGMMWNGAVAWLPEFFKRSFGWDAAETGWRYGLADDRRRNARRHHRGTLAMRAAWPGSSTPISVSA